MSLCDGGDDLEISSSVEHTSVTVDAPNKGKSKGPSLDLKRWEHITDLDDHFTRVYRYHQRKGFSCIVLEDLLRIGQFAFVLIAAVMLMDCVRYDVLFANIVLNGTQKVTIRQVIVPFDQCATNHSFVALVLIVLGSLFLACQFFWCLREAVKFWKIRAFYQQVLEIPSSELCNKTWLDVLTKMLERQKHVRMCISKTDLNSLDVHHRILRFTNYMIAVVRTKLISFDFNLPFYGKYVFFTRGLDYNLNYLLFEGPWALFQTDYALRSEVLNRDEEEKLGQELSKVIFWFGVINFLLAPFIFFYTIFFMFFSYADLVKRQPNILGARRWTRYSRYRLRHYNELDFQLDQRFNMAYKPLNRYLNMFFSPILVIISKNLCFFAGSIFAIIAVLAVIDEDVLQVDHAITTMTVSALVASLSRAFIPEENEVYWPDDLLGEVQLQLHMSANILRDDQPNKDGYQMFSDVDKDEKLSSIDARVAHRMSQLFGLRVAALIEELISPLIVPFFLWFRLRPEARRLIKFIRENTETVDGVGHVCSASLMVPSRPSAWPPKSGPGDKGVGDRHSRRTLEEDFESERSLVAFTVNNPHWRPTNEKARQFVDSFQDTLRSVMGDLVSKTYTSNSSTLQSSIANRLPSYSSALSSWGNSMYGTANPRGYGLSRMSQFGRSNLLLQSGQPNNVTGLMMRSTLLMSAAGLNTVLSHRDEEDLSRANDQIFQAQYSVPLLVLAHNRQLAETRSSYGTTAGASTSGTRPPDTDTDSDDPTNDDSDSTPEDPPHSRQVSQAPTTMQKLFRFVSSKTDRPDYQERQALIETPEI